MGCAEGKTIVSLFITRVDGDDPGTTSFAILNCFFREKINRVSPADPEKKKKR